MKGEIEENEIFATIGLYLIRLSGMQKKKHRIFIPDLAYCITTSGTTGKPKIVHVPYECITKNIEHFR